MKLELYHAEFQKIRPFMAEHNYHAIIEALQGRKPLYLSAPPSHRAAFHYVLATAYSKTGNYKQADHHFDAALSAVPNNHKVKLEMSESLMQRGELPQAEKLLLELSEDPYMEHGGLSRRFHLMVGKYFKLAGDYPSARQSFLEAQKLELQDRGPSKDLRLMEEFIGASLGKSEHTRGALEYAHHLSCLDAKNAGKTELGLTFLRNYSKHLSNIDDKLQCLSSLAILSLQSGHTAEAFHYNEQALALDGNHARSLAGRIRMLFEVGKKDEALDRYQSDKQIIRDDPRATLALAKTFKHEGFPDIANRIAERLLKMDTLPAETRKDAVSIASITRSIINRELLNG